MRYCLWYAFRDLGAFQDCREPEFCNQFRFERVTVFWRVRINNSNLLIFTEYCIDMVLPFWWRYLAPSGSDIWKYQNPEVFLGVKAGINAVFT